MVLLYNIRGGLGGLPIVDLNAIKCINHRKKNNCVCSTSLIPADTFLLSFFFFSLHKYLPSTSHLTAYIIFNYVLLAIFLTQTYPLPFNPTRFCFFPVLSSRSSPTKLMYANSACSLLENSTLHLPYVPEN